MCGLFWPGWVVDALHRPGFSGSAVSCGCDVDRCAPASESGLLTPSFCRCWESGLCRGSGYCVANQQQLGSFQVERQFSVGDWVEIDGSVGRVETVSWNSAYLYDNRRIESLSCQTPSLTLEK